MDGEHLYWKYLIINASLALLLTAKVTNNAPSLNFLDYFMGGAMFILLAAGVNTDKNVWNDFHGC